MTPTPTTTVTWPRWAALAAEALAAGLAVALVAAGLAGVWAVAGIEPVRPFLAVASGFLVGAAARGAKDARQLWATYRNWRGHQLDQLCARLETRRARRGWSHTPEPSENAADNPDQRPAGQLVAARGVAARDEDQP